ncbi:hypothetical protein BC835DRAFT_1414872 [Cytidiella melzeri]|nr:hypothetical protein BC835DRAFT_1414872 [Cytidiella melzeri]
MSQALSYLSYEGGGDDNDNDQSDGEVYDDGLPTGQMRAMNLDSRGNSHSSSVSMLRRALRPGVPPTIGVDAMQALTQAEIQIAEVNERLKQSEQERRELADALRLTKRRGKGRSRPQEDNNDPEAVLLRLRQRKVQECAQKYAVLYRPWASKLTCDTLSVHRPVVDEARRYDSTESQEKAHQAEMWDVLAANPDVKPILGLANWLHGAFREAVHKEKSKFVHAAVVNVVDIFSSLGVNSESVGTAAARKACEALQAIGPQNANHFYPDILFPDDRPGQLAWLFKTKRIVYVIKSGILGIGSIKGNSNTLAKAHKWGITTVTPGLIAFAATVLIYLVSGDDSFTVASSTKSVTYDYQSLFDRYVKLLHTKSRGTELLIVWMNKEVFGKDNANIPDTGPAAPNDDINAQNMEIEAMFGDVGIETASRSPSPSSPTIADQPLPPQVPSPLLAAPAAPARPRPHSLAPAARLPSLAPGHAAPRSVSMQPALYLPRSVSSRAREPDALPSTPREAPPAEPVGRVVHPGAPAVPLRSSSDVPAVLLAPPGLGPPRGSLAISDGVELMNESLPTDKPATQQKRGKKATTIARATGAAAGEEHIVTRRSTRKKP